ncbi:MAG: VCBS repeat-containing protein [Bacteroidia bacterium]|nr:VCBS repeat-containing protein [Bacteroidia bacterium]
MTSILRKFVSILLIFFCFQCKDDAKKNTTDSKTKTTSYFLELVDSNHTNVTFRNSVIENENINYLRFEGIYNGSGVAIGDINNDGLPDIYFAGNSSEDKLYLNKGDLKFEDISLPSGIAQHANGWSTGVNMVDINADGFLDIYVCRSGPEKDPILLENKLFINNKDNTFNETAAQYGLNSNLQSRQTAFFDYDLDGDLDMYLMNQPAKDFSGGEFFQYLEQLNSGKLQTDYFYENVNGNFVDKTKEAGLVNFGYGHSIAVTDINNDGYPDFHKTNDYDDPDFLFINSGNKTFENKINDYFKHISWSSMGNDAADFNNDGLIDIMALEMAPDDHVRSKVNMKAMDPIKFNALANNGQQYQYMFNTLQLNNGNNSFSEIAQISGMAKTDWSWACLFFDIDNDGFKDVFISNGIKKDFLNRDLSFMTKQRSQELGRSMNINEFHEIIPSNVSENLIFKNNADLTFETQTNTWMNKVLFNTNGVAYGDLDNDGDLDLVTNNMEALASIYENKANDGQGGNYVKFKLKGAELNPFAIGTKIVFESNGKNFIQELNNARGYLSSMNHELVFGIGNLKTLSEVKVVWPDQKVTLLNDVKANQTITVSYDDKNPRYEHTVSQPSMLEKINARSLGITFEHKENKHDDYKTQVLLPYSQSTNGPFIDKADVNGDGLEDFYIGGAINQPGELYLQLPNGRFTKQFSATWENDKDHEDLGVHFFDADNDNDIDLYVVSGGSEFPENHMNYQDRLYLNDGQGNFIRSRPSLPTFYTSGQVVKSADMDGDGDLDLFIGGRIIPDKYPYPPSAHILINENGKFSDQTENWAPYLKAHSIITGAEFFDYDNDGDQDLMTVGEWSTVDIHKNTDGKFDLIQAEGLENSRGLWFGLDAEDVDADGDLDFIAGNLGLNTKFIANAKKEFHVFCDDFDNSGTFDVVLSNTYNGNLVPVRGRECSSQQMPFIKDRFETFQSFAEADLEDIIGTNNMESALHYQIDLLSSIYIENLGDGSFKMHDLPNEAQLSPILNTQLLDVDKDGIKDLITMGNLYGVEVETVRFDASIGAILKGGKLEETISAIRSGLYLDNDVRGSVVIGKYLIVANNNSAPDIFEIK